MKAFVFVFCVLFSSLASAAPAAFSNALEYESLSEEQRQLFLSYTFGVGQGLQLANVVLEKNGKEPLYCASMKLSLTVQNYQMIFEKELKKHLKIYREVSGNEPFPVEVVLLAGLKSTFPCKK